MANSDEGCNRPASEERSMKALWASICSLEQKIDNLTLEIRHALLHLPHRESLTEGVASSRERDVARPSPIIIRTQFSPHHHPDARSKPLDLTDLTTSHTLHQRQFIDHYDSDDEIEAPLYEEPRCKSNQTFGEPHPGHNFGNQNSFPLQVPTTDSSPSVDLSPSVPCGTHSRNPSHEASKNISTHALLCGPHSSMPTKSLPFFPSRCPSHTTSNHISPHVLSSGPHLTMPTHSLYKSHSREPPHEVSKHISTHVSSNGPLSSIPTQSSHLSPSLYTQSFLNTSSSPTHSILPLSHIQIFPHCTLPHDVSSPLVINSNHPTTPLCVQPKGLTTIHSSNANPIKI